MTTVHAASGGGLRCYAFIIRVVERSVVAGGTAAVDGPCDDWLYTAVRGIGKMMQRCQFEAKRDGRLRPRYGA
jgi:hypothetical protein